MSKALVLFRDDFRLADNPAFNAACQDDREIVCLHVIESDTALRPLGSAVRWWLSGAINDLRDTLQKMGGDLWVVEGDSTRVVPSLVQHLEIEDVYAHARYEGAARRSDATLREVLSQHNIGFHQYHANVLRPPEALKTGAGQPYKVFSSFWRAFQEAEPVLTPLSAPSRICFCINVTLPDGLTRFDERTLVPKHPDWAASIAKVWTPGEAAARKRLDDFISGQLEVYNSRRDFPSHEGTSRMSPYLRFGHISPRQIFHALDRKQGKGAWRFRSELGWRDFATSNLVSNPEMATRNLRAQFDKMEWAHDEAQLKRWQSGQTGVPIVDAGMRQLWQTGWMHNRVRMVVGSFLTKHLLTHWQKGESWFWDTLVDADLASNAMNWQWVAGTGIDAAPYFRIFNPVLQGEKFDKDGAYIREFVPELAKLPNAYLHHPWDASKEVCEAAGIVFGKTYPHPCVDLKEGRARALKAFEKL